jgi:hypothetical protein
MIGFSPIGKVVSAQMCSSSRWAKRAAQLEQQE